jgi:large subunit ribosomal protein L1
MAEAKKKTTTKAKATKVKAVADDDSNTPVGTSDISTTVIDTPVQEVAEGAVPKEKKLAKAGKRSAKAIEEAEEKVAKEERKDLDDDSEKPKQHSNPTRTRLARRGKNFRKNAEAVEVGKVYELKEAIALAQKTSHVKFDASVELHVNLNVDPRHADQNIRDNLVLPAGTGKAIRVAVLTDDAAAATKAGADFAGNEELLAQLDKGQMNFDILIAVPTLMAKLGKYARMLGPRGLMPNPKSGTVTTDVAKAVKEAKAGRVEYRVDSTGIVHLGVGKVSFTEAQLMENIQAVLQSIKNNKPASVKGSYFKVAHLATSMGPSVTVDLSSVN